MRPLSCETAGKVLWHLALGQKERYQCWLEFLRHLVARGLRAPVTITSDGVPGELRAIAEVWPQSLRVRCWVHTMRNVLDKVPDSARAEVKAHVLAFRDAPTLEAGRQAAVEVLEQYSRTYPSAMASLSEDLEARLNHLLMPVNHRRYIRTTKLDRTELPGRAPAHQDHPAVLRRTELSEAGLRDAAAGQPALAAHPDHGTRVETDGSLRHHLGLDPDPVPTNRTREKKEVAA